MVRLWRVISRSPSLVRCRTDACSGRGSELGLIIHRSARFVSRRLASFWLVSRQIKSESHATHRQTWVGQSAGTRSPRFGSNRFDSLRFHSARILSFPVGSFPFDSCLIASNQIRVSRHPSSNMGGAIGGHTLASPRIGSHRILSIRFVSRRIKSNHNIEYMGK